MRLDHPPERLHRLAAAWALGTLRGGARRRFEAVARHNAPVRAAALLWRERLAALVELVPPQPAPPGLWSRIEADVRASIRAESTAVRSPAHARGAASALADGVRDGLLRRLALWRMGALAGAAAAVVALAVGVRLAGETARLEQSAQADQAQLAQLRAQLAARPELRYVAVLSDEQASASLLVTFDAANRRLTLQRLNNFQEGDDRSLQLWAVPPAGGPRSLGVLDNARLVRLPADESRLQELPLLAISLEPRGGVPEAGGPTGPVLFKGALLRTPL